MKKLPTIKQCEEQVITKGNLAEQLYGDYLYDSAIPQQLADQLQKFIDGPAAQMVFGYQHGEAFGTLLPLTQEAAEAIMEWVENDFEMRLAWEKFDLKGTMVVREWGVDKL